MNAGSLNRVWRLLRGGVRPAPAPPVLPARRAYDLWSASYDSPPTPLQGIEAEARRALLPDLGGARVLDLGCGTGRAGRDALAGGAAAVVGYDFSRPMLARAARERPARERPAARSAEAGGSRVDSSSASGRTSLVAGDAVSLPFRSGAFDGVVSALVLGHVRDVEAALGEMARVCKAGSFLLITEFHPAAAARGWDRTFVEEGTGLTYAVEHHAHSLADYIEALLRSGCRVDALVEREWDGTPVVFALRAITGGGR